MTGTTDPIDLSVDERSADRPADPATTSDGDDDDDGADDGRDRTGGGRRRWYRRIDKGLLLVSVIIALGLFLVARGLAAGVTGDGSDDLPDAVEQVDPVPNAVQALNQTRIYADLEQGHTGVFVIDGLEIETVDVAEISQAVQAGEQIELPPVTVYEQGNATLTFTPNDSAPITGFESGRHRVQLIYWQVEVGRQRAKSYTWTFDVV